jgi:glycosyltransferase involved in cell wall biosynthesis
MALLTILVPTYNRVARLAELLARLDEELATATGVRVLVADNASQDGTAEALREASTRYPWLTAHRRPENVGAPANIAWLVEHAPEAEYAWILCDDDLPLPGAVRAVQELLEQERPAWLFLPYSFVDAQGNPGDGVPEPGAIERHPSSGSLFRAHHHWLTFASASVVRREPLRDAMRRIGGGNAYFAFLWSFAAGLHAPCVVAPHRVLVGSLDITWRDRLSAFLTLEVVGLYDAGVREDVSAEEFATTLDQRYLHGDGVWAMEMWEAVGIDRLAENVTRFPTAVSLRSHLFMLGVKRGDRSVLPVLRRAAAATGAAEEARRLVADGEAAFGAGDVIAAETRFRGAVRADPTLAAAWNNLDVVLFAVQDPSAGPAVERALFAAPDDVDARLNRASIRLARGDPAGAADDARHALAADPGNADASELLATSGG